MSDYISREQALKAIKRLCEKNEDKIGAWLENSLEEIIEELPAMLTGKWKVITDPSEWGTYNAVCSNCGEKYFFPKIFHGEYYKVCPKCGSRMER